MKHTIIRNIRAGNGTHNPTHDPKARSTSGAKRLIGVPLSAGAWAAEGVQVPAGVAITVACFRTVVQFTRVERIGVLCIPLRYGGTHVLCIAIFSFAEYD